MRKTAKKIQLAFDPAKDLLRGRQDFKETKAVWISTNQYSERSQSVSVWQMNKHHDEIRVLKQGRDAHI